MRRISGFRGIKAQHQAGHASPPVNGFVYFLSLSSLACLLALSCAPGWSNKWSASVGSATPVVGSWDEVTTAVIAPGEHPACPGGRYFFGAGTTVASTDFSGNLDPATMNPRTLVPANGSGKPTVQPIWDNHLVKGENGVLIHTVEGVTWWPEITPKPAWWNLTAEAAMRTYPVPPSHPDYNLPIKVAGARGTIWVFRSTDCGQSWHEVTPIDSAVVEVPGLEGQPSLGAICGYPRFKKATYGKAPNTFTGPGAAAAWDAHFLYADPDPGDLYVTTLCARGEPLEVDFSDPPPYDSKWNKERFDGLILHSEDNGDSWEVICYRPDIQGWWGRIPLTTLPHGRIAYAWVANATEHKPQTLWISSFDRGSNCSESLTEKPVRGLGPALFAGRKDDEVLRVMNRFSLARGGTSEEHVQIASFAFFGDGERLGTVVKDITLDGNGSDWALDLAEGTDHVFPTFVEGPPGTNTAVLYYLRRTFDEAADKSRLEVRFAALAEGKRAGEGVLTVNGGAKSSWLLERRSGDYMGGASYAHGERIVFVLSWVQNAELHFNTVTLERAERSEVTYDTNKVYVPPERLDILLPSPLPQLVPDEVEGPLELPYPKGRLQFLDEALRIHRDRG